MEKSHDPALVSGAVLASERKALDRWGKGDPEGYLTISASDVDQALGNDETDLHWDSYHYPRY